LHVYGQALALGEKGREFGQHKGLGKKLMAEVVKIMKKNKIKNLKVISGVGVREYYRKLGYNLKNPFLLLKKSIKGREIFVFIEEYDKAKKLILDSLDIQETYFPSNYDEISGSIFEMILFIIVGIIQLKK